MLNIIYSPKISIYQRIETLIRTQGELPEDFEAQECQYGENEIGFAPGAKEGIFGHHCGEEKKESTFAQKLKEYLELEEKEALKRFEEEEAKNFITTTEYMPLLKYIMAHGQEYNPGKVASLGYCFASKGTKCETVKLGLTLLALFNMSDNEKVCTLLENLGYCEEFTTYVVINVADWEEQKKQELFFRLAKKLKGWGKIDIVERMTADTEEKKEWLLCYGCKNSVMNAYLAYECAGKCDLYERLQRGFLTEAQLQGAFEIMKGLLDEGPCEGMSAMEDPVGLTMAYLEELERHELNVCYLKQVYDIFDYFFESGLEDSAVIGVKTMDIIGQADGETLIRKEMKEHTYECLKLSRHFQVDLSKELYLLMEQDFARYYLYVDYILHQGSLVEEFFRLCELKIDESLYPKGMGALVWSADLAKRALHLDIIVQYMHKHPLQGKKLLEICIQSPIIRWRHLAAKALLGWTKRLGESLEKIDRKLYDMVRRVCAEECDETVRKMWESLL